MVCVRSLLLDYIISLWLFWKCLRLAPVVILAQNDEHHLVIRWTLLASLPVPINFLRLQVDAFLVERLLLLDGKECPRLLSSTATHEEDEGYID